MAIQVNVGKRIQIWWLFQRGVMCRFMGHKLVQRRWYEAAADLFTRVLALNPTHGKALVARGVIYWRELQQSDHAITDFSISLGLVPDHAEVLFYRGMAYQQCGDYRAAVEDLTMAVTLAPRASWCRNAQNQLMLMQAIVDELPERLHDAPLRLHAGKETPPSNQ